MIGLAPTAAAIAEAAAGPGGALPAGLATTVPRPTTQAFQAIPAAAVVTVEVAEAAAEMVAEAINSNRAGPFLPVPQDFLDSF